MNYLAHLYLSGNSDGIIIGNFIADSVKGNHLKNYSEEIQNGILLHRKIDFFTDKNEIVRQSKKRLMPKHRKYSTVIVDVFYDHILAVNWKKYSSVPLRNFCDSKYLLLKKYAHLFPEKSKIFLEYMIKNDTLFNYSTLKGIKKSLCGLSYRARFQSTMHKADKDLEIDYHFYQNEFEIFFEELKIECANIFQKNYRPAYSEQGGNEEKNQKQSITLSLPTP